MTDAQQLDFLTAFGEEFSEVLATPVGWDNITPQDGYEVFLRVFQREPTPQLLAQISDPDVEKLAAGCKAYFENGSITSSHLRTAISRTLARYPVEGVES